MRKNGESQSRSVTRREFLLIGAAAAAGIASSGWKKSRAYALAGPGRVIGANDRINVGVIGCGGMGTHHLRKLVDASKSGKENIQVIAVCDIYEKRLNNAVQISGAKPFKDYRKLLEWQDVDVVWIATPEHWHARMAIDAMEAGKDIYLEKPFTRYLDEAKQVYETALRTKSVVQVGSQGCSENVWHRAAELVKSGKLGKVVWAQASYCRNSKEGEWNYPIDPDAKPGVNLDWDAFLGPAPKRPWDPERFFRWRKFWDYSGGIGTDLFPHVLNTLLLAIGAEFPTRVVASGGIYVHKDREVPDTYHMIVEYPGNYNVVVLSSMANEVGVPTLIRGHEATMEISGNRIIIRPTRPYAEEREVEEVQVEPTPDSVAAHHKNFFECVRTRGKPNCDVELAYKVMVAVGLAELSYRQDKVMKFDPSTQRVIS
ncbi:MAG: hypothetical protein GDYSWBUE_001166 [Candidatus Fervidibacterota bacterium]